VKETDLMFAILHQDVCAQLVLVLILSFCFQNPNWHLLIWMK